MTLINGETVGGVGGENREIGRRVAYQPTRYHRSADCHWDIRASWILINFGHLRYSQRVCVVDDVVNT